MIQDRFHISASDAREPFEELINRRTITQVLKQSSYRNASAAKHPCSADFVTVSLDRIQIVPVSVQFFAPWNSDNGTSPGIVSSNSGGLCLASVIQFTSRHGSCHQISTDTGCGRNTGSETSEIENLVIAEHSEELLPRFRPGKLGKAAAKKAAGLSGKQPGHPMLKHWAKAAASQVTIGWPQIFPDGPKYFPVE